MYHSNGDSQSGGYSSVAHASSDALSITGPSDGAQAQPAHSETYGSIVGYAFTVNYILGVGVLGMPYAFYKGGWVLSAMCLGLVSVMAGFTALWLVDVSLRAQYVKRQDRLLREAESWTRAETCTASASAREGRTKTWRCRRPSRPETTTDMR